MQLAVHNGLSFAQLDSLAFSKQIGLRDSDRPPPAMWNTGMAHAQSAMLSSSSLRTAVRVPFVHAAHKGSRCNSHVQRTCAQLDAGDAEDAGTARRHVLIQIAAAAVLAPFVDPVSVLASTVSSGATVFVAGATGNTGQRVVRQLSEKGYKVLAGVRDQKKADKLFGADSNVKIVKYNLFDMESIASVIGGADAMVSTLGYSGFNLGQYKQVDSVGTANLIEAAKKAGVKKFVLLTSLLTNAKAVGQADNNNYKFLNAFGGVLDNKLEAEKALRSSGLDWTIVRPGGLSNDSAENLGGLYVSKEDTLFGVDSDPGRSISRDKVAEVIVEALSQRGAEQKVVEIVQGKKVPQLPTDKYFDI